MDIFINYRFNKHTIQTHFFGKCPRRSIWLRGVSSGQMAGACWTVVSEPFTVHLGTAKCLTSGICCGGIGLVKA